MTQSSCALDLGNWAGDCSSAAKGMPGSGCVESGIENSLVDTLNMPIRHPRGKPKETGGYITL